MSSPIRRVLRAPAPGRTSTDRTGRPPPGVTSASRGRAALRSTRPDAGLHVIKGAGHWVAYEAPEEFNAIALNILRDAEGA